MLKSFGIDSLVSNLKQKIPDTFQIANPQYVTANQQQKTISGKLHRAKLKFADLSLEDLPEDASESRIQRLEAKKAELQLEIECYQADLADMKQKKKGLDKRIDIRNVHPDQVFHSAINQRKHFLDTIKIIAYRAETALCNQIREHMSHPGQARELVRQIYQSDADMQVDQVNNLLIVKIHHLNQNHQDQAMKKLIDELNQTQTVFPASNLTLFYKLVSE